MTHSFPVDAAPRVLMSFEDVLLEAFRGKQYEWTAQPAAPVPANILELWRDRGFDPSATGIALVVFFDEGRASKPYTYPAYFWGAT